MKLQPLLYLPVGRVLIEHAYPMLRCTAYTVSPVHLLQVRDQFVRAPAVPLSRILIDSNPSSSLDPKVDYLYECLPTPNLPDCTPALRDALLHPIDCRQVLL